MNKNALNSVDDYIALQPKTAQAVLERVRRAIRNGVPQAEEVISYNMPTFQLNGRAVLSFRWVEAALLALPLRGPSY